MIEEQPEWKEVQGRLRNFVLTYARHKGYEVNRDPARLEQLLAEMARNQIEFGKPYCPCLTKRISGDKEADRKIICPCLWHREDIEQKGHCLCELFFKA